MNLSFEQETLIPVFTEKWLKIAFSEDNIDRDRAKNTINTAYAFMGYSEPEILFFESIESIAQNIQLLLEAKIPNLHKQAQEPVLKRIGNKLGKPFSSHFQGLYRQLCVEVGSEYFALIRNQLGLDLYEKEKYFYQMYDYTTHHCSEKIKQNLNFDNYELKFISSDKLKNKLQDKFFDSIFSNSFYTADCLFIDYCHEVLNCNCNSVVWNILKSLCADCGLMMIPFQSICLVCDRYELLIKKQK